ncbi:MAG: hypothetical protein NWF06_05000 [Candidatus Bathyarchaeota archaeon]|nr:hypothetical protein [Candidatus Bathyarchaeum sp.]
MSVKERIANEVRKQASIKQLIFEKLLFTPNLDEQTSEDLAQNMNVLTIKDFTEYVEFRRQISVSVLIDEVEKLKTRLAKLEK